MATVIFAEEKEVTARADWVQTVDIPISSGFFRVTPASGKLKLFYIDVDNDYYYWDGASFLLNTPTELTTTIVGTESQYSFTIPQSAIGQTLRYEGWINGDMATLDKAEVRVRRGQAARLSF